MIPESLELPTDDLPQSRMTFPSAGPAHGRTDQSQKEPDLVRSHCRHIFGGFTPVRWDSRKWKKKKGIEDNCWKADPTVTSFLFKLNNLHNIAPWKLVLKKERNNEAIYFRSEWSLCFGDIGVCDRCDTNNHSYTWLFGIDCTNDTELDGGTFFTGSHTFQVKKIEVFEITD
jgi:hypothetical protein